MKFKNIINESEFIFIRKATKQEDISQSKKRDAMHSFPEKDGYSVVYKQYDEHGNRNSGFYYAKNKS